MTASQRRTVTVVVAALGVAFLLMWSAQAGPEHLLLEQRAEPATTQVEQEAPAVPEDDPADDERRSDDQAATGGDEWVGDVTTFVLLVAGLLVTALILRQLFIRISSQLADERLVVPLEPLPDLAVAREAIRRAQQRQRDLLGGSDVRNGIVSCWVVFEEAAAEAGVARHPAETASAFVVRLLHLLDVDPRPVGELAQLFLEARFSTHPLPPQTRDRAERALRSIHLDLAHAGATP